MTQNEMIEQFKKQLEEVVTKIKELDQELNLKKEEYFKLTGAVQALELAAKESESPTAGGTITDTFDLYSFRCIALLALAPASSAFLGLGISCFLLIAFLQRLLWSLVMW